MRAAPILIAATLLLTASGAALAQDDGYGYRFHPDGDSGLSSFAGLRGSLAFTSAVSTTIPTATPTNLHGTYSNGGGGSIYLGTRLPWGLRVELEALYRDLPFSKVSLNGTPAVAHGTSQVGAPMLNLFWDLPVPDFPLRPFIGAGIGGAYIADNLHDATNTNTYLKSNNWHLAYDLMGGAEIPLSQSSRFTAMYRWLQTEDGNGLCGVSGTPTLACKTKLNSQSVDLGIEMDM